MPENFGDHEQKSNDATAVEHRQDSERTVTRNPHPDFVKVEASRPDWRHGDRWHFTKTVNPRWKLGDGANDDGESLKRDHVEIDPYANGRPAVFNYKLLMLVVECLRLPFLPSSCVNRSATYSICLDSS